MSKERLLHIKTFKVPITREKDPEIIGKYKVQEATMEFTEDMVTNTEEVKLKSPMLELPALTKKVGQFNERQIKFAEASLNKDYILKKIITK